MNHTEGGMRLNQYLASCGICSRREADRLIEEVRVYVDGRPAIPGMRVTGREEILVDEKPVRARREKTVVAWYKPVGVTCTETDPHAEKTSREAFHYPVRLTYAGRLDRDSEGLMIMTDDGALINAMMKGAAGHEKEYIVRVRSRISDQDLVRLSKGIYLKDLEMKTRPCRVERLGDRTFRIVLTQGLNRQIRRMCRAVGHEVRILKRVRIVNVLLGGMKPGESREITGREKAELYKTVGMPIH